MQIFGYLADYGRFWDVFVEVLKSFLGEGRVLSGKSYEAEQEGAWLEFRITLTLTAAVEIVYMIDTLFLIRGVVDGR